MNIELINAKLEARFAGDLEKAARRADEDGLQAIKQDENESQVPSGSTEGKSYTVKVQRHPYYRMTCECRGSRGYGRVCKHMGAVHNSEKASLRQNGPGTEKDNS